MALEDLLEKEMATHSSILSVENPMDRGVCQAMGPVVSECWTQATEYSTETEN